MLAPPALQKYLYQSPGEGNSVVYAIANVVDGKAYVGKHAHGNLGKSAESSRIKAFLHPEVNDTTYKANAVRKHGAVSFVRFILWHGGVCEENDSECFWISPGGLHTNKDIGWGYNDRGGGEGGGFSASTIMNMKEARNTDEYKRNASANGKKQFESPEMLKATTDHLEKMWKDRLASGLPTNADYLSNYWKNQTASQEAYRVNQIKKSMATTESKTKRSNIAKAHSKLLREEKLSTLSPRARKSQELKNAREDRKTEKKRRDLACLQSIPGHEDDVYRNLPAARKAGLLLCRLQLPQHHQSTCKAIYVRNLTCIGNVCGSKLKHCAPWGRRS